MTWFNVIKVMSDDMDECCRQIRERIRTDARCISEGIPEMIVNMECDELRHFLVSQGEGLPVTIPDGRQINFSHSPNRILRQHMQDLADIFNECLDGAEEVTFDANDTTDWRSKFT